MALQESTPPIAGLGTSPRVPFAQVPRTAEGHFVLCLYAAILRLMAHVHRICALSGTSFETIEGRYAFIGRYLEEVRRELPPGMPWLEASSWWWKETSRWQARIPVVRLPLRDLMVEGGVEPDGLLAFMLVGLVEEDSRFGTLLAELQQPLAYRRPALELVGQVMSESGDPAGSSAWELCRPLIEGGLVEVVDRKPPRAEWVLRVPPVLWDAARGQHQELALPWGSVHAEDRFPALPGLVCPAELHSRLTRLPGLLPTPRDPVDNGKARTLVLRSAAGSDVLEIAGSLARSLGRCLISVESEHSAAPEMQALIGPLATLTRSIPFVRYELGPGETATPPRHPGYRGVSFVGLGLEGGLAEEPGQRSLTLSLPAPDRRLRRRLWQSALSGPDSEDLDAIATSFHLGGGYIRQAAAIATARAALDSRPQVRLSDVREAARDVGRQQLDNLAALLESEGSWSQLVCGRATSDKLSELERRCRHRELLLEHLGPAFQSNSNRGVRALFSGASGTGKTYAARILAAELGQDLYRVDLASVINKYIGETEKNLHRILTRAEALDVMLLLDEGDSLLGSRTDVRSANDRYANLETNYLLQRLENYEGVIVVTTNLGDNIDSAFQRRMDVVVPFLMPTAHERWRILDLHLPEDHRVPGEMLDRVASACQLSGGQLRNAALHASLLALDEGGETVAGRHLEAAIASEYRKAGAVYPLSGQGVRPDHGGVASFIAALTEER